MSKAVRAKSFTVSLSAGMRRIVDATSPSGTYRICAVDMEPAFVLARLLDVLGLLDPEAHARLTGPGSAYRSVPAYAMDDAKNPWWAAPAGTALIAGIVGAINAGAHPQYVCDLHLDGHIALVSLGPAPSVDDSPPSSARYRKVAAS